MNYRNNINTYADITTYNADANKDYPNVSYIKGTNEVKMFKYDPEYLVCKYNVTSTSTAIDLSNKTNNITKQYIDGVEQQSIQTTYTFPTTGVHIVKYKFSGSTIKAGIGYASGFFYNCINMKNLTIPTNITTIGNNAFYSCRGLTSVFIPSSVTTIESYVFTNCTGLTSITIPNSVTTIGNGAFSRCSQLTSVTVLATVPPTLGTDVFANNASGRKIYVPSASVATYKAASGWSTYAAYIEAIPS